MKSILKFNTLLSRRLVIIVAFVIIIVSCHKTDNTVSSPKTAAKFCGTMSWSNSVEQSGIFTGSTANGSYTLTDIQFTENGNTGDYQLHYDTNGRLINDQTGVVYTYTQNYLSQIAVQELVSDGNGAGSYNFDSNGHLTTGIITFTSSELTGTITGTYTYDSNEDPVRFVATGVLNTPDGPMNYNLEIDGNFLLDKTSLLPFNPVFAPASSYFSIIPFLSKHLLNYWEVSFGGTINNKQVTPKHSTISYTYSYNADGNVATMVNDGNLSNTYSFTYSNCK
jgi:hypothetical protein